MVRSVVCLRRRDRLRACAQPGSVTCVSVVAWVPRFLHVCAPLHDSLHSMSSRRSRHLTRLLLQSTTCLAFLLEGAATRQRHSARPTQLRAAFFRRPIGGRRALACHLASLRRPVQRSRVKRAHRQQRPRPPAHAVLLGRRLPRPVPRARVPPRSHCRRPRRCRTVRAARRAASPARNRRQRRTAAQRTTRATTMPCCPTASARKSVLPLAPLLTTSICRRSGTAFRMVRTSSCHRYPRQRTLRAERRHTRT